jgi:hypothetical protein
MRGEKDGVLEFYHRGKKKELWTREQVAIYKVDVPNGGTSRFSLIVPTYDFALCYYAYPI